MKPEKLSRYPDPQAMLEGKIAIDQPRKNRETEDRFYDEILEEMLEVKDRG